MENNHLRSEGRENRVYYQKHKESHRDRRLGEPVHDQRRDEREPIPRPERNEPRSKGMVASGPVRSEPSAGNLEGEINEHRDGQILPQKALFDHFQRCSGLVGCKANFGEKVHDNEELNICPESDFCSEKKTLKLTSQFAYGPNLFIDSFDAHVRIAESFLSLQTIFK
jgi:hypothetical protein